MDRILDFLEQRKSLLLALGIVALVVDLAFAAVVLGSVSNYQHALEETEGFYAQKILDSSDRTLESYTNSYRDNLSYVIGQDSFKEVEARSIQDADHQDLLEFFQDSMIHSEVPFGAVAIFPDGSMHLSEELQRAGLSERSIRDTLECKGCICSSLDDSAFLALFQESEAGVTYGLLFDMGAFYETAFGLQADSEDYLIALHDQASDFFVYQEGDRVVAKCNPEDDALADEGLYYLRLAWMNGESRSDAYENRYAGTSEYYRAKIHSVPVAQTRNQLLCLGVSINFDTLSAPSERTLPGIALGMVVVSVLFLVIIAAAFFTARKHREDKAQIKLLQEKNRELSLLHDQMNDNLHHQRLEAMGTLTSGIAHEFNNLLSPIMGYTSMAVEEAAGECRSDAIIDSLGEVYSSAERAKLLVRRISDLSRKNTDSTMAALCVDSLAREGIESIRMLCPEGVRIEGHLGAPDARVVGNSAQLSQMLFNLMLNAMQELSSSGREDGVIAVSTRVEDTVLVIEIEDNGPGIPIQDRQRIFDPFFTTKKPGEGTGLGLSIVAQVVEEHGGGIAVGEGAMHGACFTVAIPLASQGEDGQDASKGQDAPREQD